MMPSEFHEVFTKVEEDQESRIGIGQPNHFCNKVKSWFDMSDITCRSVVTTTGDGYRLRIFNLKKKGLEKGNRAVFLQHGLMSDSWTWVVSGKKSVAYDLVTAGFDVWIGNCRGSMWSANNSYSDSNWSFYNFSGWHLANYDVPAQIDKVKSETGVSKVSVVAHSLGTYMFFWALADNYGNVRKKVDVYAAMAPCLRMDNTPAGIFKVAKGLEAGLMAMLAVHSYPLCLEHMMDGICAFSSTLCSAITSYFGKTGYMDTTSFNN